MKLGGLTMDRTTPTRDTRSAFAQWLDRAMANHYGPKYRNNQLARDTGNAIREQVISRWLNGDVETPSIPLVRLAATTLEANLAEALTAAGYGDLVKEVNYSLAEAQLDQSETIDLLARELDALEEATQEKIKALREAIARGRARREAQTPDADGNHTGAH